MEVIHGDLRVFFDKPEFELDLVILVDQADMRLVDSMR